MAIHLIIYMPDILHHIWHPASVSLANTYMRHHLSALPALENHHQLVLQLHKSCVKPM